MVTQKTEIHRKQRKTRVVYRERQQRTTKDNTEQRFLGKEIIKLSKVVLSCLMLSFNILSLSFIVWLSFVVFLLCSVLHGAYLCVSACKRQQGTTKDNMGQRFLGKEIKGCLRLS